MGWTRRPRPTAAAQIKVVDDFACTHVRRAVVTSRTYAYQQQEWRLHGFAEAVLDFLYAAADLPRLWIAGTHVAVVRHLNAGDARSLELLKRDLWQRPSDVLIRKK